MRRLSNEAGYTLIELWIGVFMLGILAMLSYARMRVPLEHAKVNGAASILASDLQYAQLLASRQRKPVVMILNTTARSYVIRDRANAALVYRTRDLGSDTDSALDQMAVLPSPTVVIFPTGVTQATTTFMLALKGFQRHVRITRAGQVRVINVS
jgi:Tfp pilus assembly protein FimT